MNKLIVKSLEEQNLSFLVRIPEPLMTEYEVKQVEWIRHYAAKYSEAPTVERLADEFEFFMVERTTDPLQDVFDQEIAYKRNLYFINAVNSNQEKLRAGADPADLVNEFASIFKVSSHKALSTKTHSRLIDYTAASQSFEFGIKLIDEATGGISFGDYVLIVGRPGSRKTTFLESILSAAMLSGYKILYVSNENPADEVMPKIDSQIAGFNPMKLRTREWTDAEKCKLRAIDWVMRMSGGEIIVPEDPCLTVEDVQAHVETHDPDIIAIDGIYLMTSSGRASAMGWEEMAAASRSLKRYARKVGKPIIGTIQAGRAAEGDMVSRGTVAGTDAFLQDCDTLVSLNNRGDRTLGQVIKSRWGATPLASTFELHIDYDNMWISSTSDSAKMTVVEDW